MAKKNRLPGAISLGQRLHQWSFAHDAQADRRLDWLRASLRVILIMYQEFFRTNISIRAAALTYALILSLVPTLALSTSILKGLGSDAQLKLVVIRLIDQLEPPPPPKATTKAAQDGEEALAANARQGDAKSLAADQEGEGESSAPPKNGKTSLRPPVPSYLHNAVDLVFEYVDHTNFAALGLIGVIGLLGIFILVLYSIEDAMNAIWHSHQGRSLLRRLMDYLALVILLPISMNIAVAADAVLANKKLMSYLTLILPSPWAIAFFIKLVPFLFIVLTLMVMYIFFPRDKVHTSAAFAGAFFAAIFWFFFQKIYIMLQIGVASYNAIYGSFATIPLVLIWLNLGMTSILLGASLAHAIQYRNQYNVFTGELSPQRRLQAAFDILGIVYHNFSQRRPTTMTLLNESIPQIRRADVETVVELLINGQLLRRSAGDQELVTPVTSAELLSGSEVVELIMGNEDLLSPGGELANDALRAAKEALHSNDIFRREIAASEKTVS